MFTNIYVIIYINRDTYINISKLNKDILFKISIFIKK